VEVASGQAWEERVYDQITSFDPSLVKFYTLGKITGMLSGLKQEI